MPCVRGFQSRDMSAGCFVAREVRLRHEMFVARHGHAWPISQLNSCVWTHGYKLNLCKAVKLPGLQACLSITGSSAQLARQVSQKLWGLPHRKPLVSTSVGPSDRLARQVSQKLWATAQEAAHCCERHVVAQLSCHRGCNGAKATMDDDAHDGS